MVIETSFIKVYLHVYVVVKDKNLIVIFRKKYCLEDTKTLNMNL